ncbi:MAG: peptidase [Gammaproteobacteria bacterium]|nr:MAG: peptidase [Gammaproteobacteria bacterium]
MGVDFLMNIMQKIISGIMIAGLLLINGCGGGSGDSEPVTATGPEWTPGVYESEDNFKDQCENPRSGMDINGEVFPDQAGSVLHENHWLRSWSDNTYLWYIELPDIDPASESNPVDYFDLLVTPQTTASGNDKDNYHFYMDSAEYQQRIQSGSSMSYGIDWGLTSPTVPRGLYINYIEPGSPAADLALALTRGVQVIEIDGVDVETENTQTGIDTLNAGLFPSSEGETHTFLIKDVGSLTTREITIEATSVTYDPVPMVDNFSTNTGNVGYLLFHDHNFVSENKLYETITQLANNNISDLILDLRYNGGGFLYIASQLSYMIAGSSATNGQTFEQMRFNDKHTQRDPVTGNLIAPTPFYSRISQYSDTYAEGTALPQLNLSRVYILSTSGTCSASEAIINGLRGIDVDVILIGDTTCGKPYGFYATDNCGTTYFTIQFDGINQKGVGGYSDGLSPMNTMATVGEVIPGCSVADDLTVPLGGLQDPLISAALNYRATESCPPPVVKSKISGAKVHSLENKAGLMLPGLLNKKIYLQPYKKPYPE